ncbi:hypothetical protein [Chryseobacterium sp.]|uniref:hypothetical protein n=1 Tax=Chryseobacterium sp. TaxID=1871047 RepID=UPI0028A25748|nr:hypothetical protein [Chryseobacterium sp.]
MKIYHTIFLLFLILSSCQNKAQDKTSDYLEITKENASPNAQKIMTENFYWDMIDEFSPFGNDTGNDTFYIYYDWKKTNLNKNGTDFLNYDSKEFNPYNFDLNIKDKELVKKHVEKMTNQYVDLNRIDNEIISLAFTQLFLSGKIESEVKELSLKAIEREMLYLDFWDTDSKIREERLRQMKSDILKSQ